MARILIIDDDDKFLELERRMLEKAGYDNIVEASDGNAGMKLLQQQAFDLVITDIVMPDKEGIEIIRYLSKNHPEIKIIAVSGGGKIGPQDYLEMAKYLGAKRTLTKPFRQAELITAVQEVLSES